MGRQRRLLRAIWTMASSTARPQVEEHEHLVVRSSQRRWQYTGLRRGRTTRVLLIFGWLNRHTSLPILHLGVVDLAQTPRAGALGPAGTSSLHRGRDTRNSSQASPISCSWSGEEEPRIW